MLRSSQAHIQPVYLATTAPAFPGPICILEIDMSRIIKASYVLDFLPMTCAECPFHRVHSYRDGAYTGTYSDCELGYMEHCDTREFNYRARRWKDCAIACDSRVTLL